ncbi:MAG: peptide deformylase [Bacteroidales bacterium]|jgi:peptide deformylase|nr:peptide deformylase [Bacteroidales bacterium]MCI1786391.1 peptide deformylase [Bacteroidales bacterium]
MNEKRSGLVSTLIMLVIAISTFCLILVTERSDKGKVCKNDFSKEETAFITGSDSVMYVYDASDSADLKILRTPSTELSDAAIKSETFKILAEKMLATVNAPEQGGVGIAAPQIGINRRVIAVMRYDKPGNPFEIYADARIDTLYGGITKGPEGCLSVPGMKGIVPRYATAVVSYKDALSLKTVRDTVTGYTAIIFQHECDHLEGILYTDKADTVYEDEAWKAERAVYAAEGKYKKRK